jgi:hypothetical protein
VRGVEWGKIWICREGTFEALENVEKLLETVPVVVRYMGKEKSGDDQRTRRWCKSTTTRCLRACVRECTSSLSAR